VRRFLPFAFLAAASAVCAQDAALVRGTGPVFSPDGARVAFRRFEDGAFKLGVFELATGGTEWIEEGPGNAAYPAWTPNGALVYTFGNDSETAYEAWQSGSTNGYGLRIREPDGTKRDLTGGRCRDYTPCVSPDGRSVYFVTTRGVASASAAYNYAAAPRPAEADAPAVPDGSDGAGEGAPAAGSEEDRELLRAWTPPKGEPTARAVLARAERLLSSPYESVRCEAIPMLSALTMRPTAPNALPGADDETCGRANWMLAKAYDEGRFGSGRREDTYVELLAKSAARLGVAEAREWLVRRGIDPPPVKSE